MSITPGREVQAAVQAPNTLRVFVLMVAWPAAIVYAVAVGNWLYEKGGLWPWPAFWRALLIIATPPLVVLLSFTRSRSTKVLSAVLVVLLAGGCAGLISQRNLTPTQLDAVVRGVVVPAGAQVTRVDGSEPCEFVPCPWVHVIYCPLHDQPLDVQRVTAVWRQGGVNLNSEQTGSMSGRAVVIPTGVDPKRLGVYDPGARPGCVVIEVESMGSLS
jgi:hypothetical protein